MPANEQRNRRAGRRVGFGNLARRGAVSAAVSAVVAAVAVLTASDASAQAPRRYTPARPTVSPYLNLLRTNASPVPNYYALVRPQLQQNEFQRQQTELQRLQNQAISNQNEEITRLETNLLKTQTTTGPTTGSSSWFQNPGGRSQFMNTRQYFLRAGGRR